MQRLRRRPIDAQRQPSRYHGWRATRACSRCPAQRRCNPRALALSLAWLCLAAASAWGRQLPVDRTPPDSASVQPVAPLVPVPEAAAGPLIEHVVQPPAAGPVAPRQIQFATPALPGDNPLPAPGLLPPERTSDDAETKMIRPLDTPIDDLDVVLGHSRVLKVNRPITSVLITDPRVAEVQVLDPKDSAFTDPRARDDQEPQANRVELLNLYGLSFGTTTLTFWDDTGTPESYMVHVGIDTEDLERRIALSLPGADVQIRQVAQQIVLEGQVPDAMTMAQVLALVQSDMRLSGQQNRGSQAEAVGLGSGGGGGGGGGGGNASTSQSMQSTGQSPLAVSNTANSQPALIVVNRVRVPGPRQILLHVKIAELNRTALREIGVSWLDTRNNSLLGSTIGQAAAISGSNSASQAAAFAPSQFLPGIAGVRPNANILAPAFQPVASTFGALGTSVNESSAQLFGIFNAGEFNLFLNALRSNSLAKILAEPNLVALDGQPATFQAGGEFPYPVPQSAALTGGGAAITIEFKRFGAILEFLAEIQTNDIIRLDVSPTFSELNFNQSVTIPNGGTVPSLNTRTARTVVELREGQTLAIAGLLSTRTAGTTVRVPGLGDIPFVGQLFSRDKIETVETELVVLVTPELVAPMDPGEVPPAPGDLVQEPTDTEFYFLGRLEGKTGSMHRATTDYLDPLQVMKHLNSENRWVVGPHGHYE